MQLTGRLSVSSALAAATVLVLVASCSRVDDGAAAFRFAALYDACGPTPGNAHRMLYSLHYQRSRNHTVLEEAMRCLGGETRCDAVLACAGERLVPRQDGIPACEYGCSGDVLNYCVPHLVYDVDCTVYGLGCRERVDVEGFLCAEPDAAACDVFTYERRCKGERPYGCSAGFERSEVRCDEHGLTCVNGQCEGTGRACEGGSVGFDAVEYDDGIACLDEATLEVCIGGRVQPVRCAMLGHGFTCRTGRPGTSDPAAFCGLGAECAPDELAELSCDGTRLTGCNAGRIDSIDCTSLGFATCTTSDRGAFCANP